VAALELASRIAAEADRPAVAERVAQMLVLRQAVPAVHGGAAGAGFTGGGAAAAAAEPPPPPPPPPARAASGFGLRAAPAAAPFITPNPRDAAAAPAAAPEPPAAARGAPGAANPFAAKKRASDAPATVGLDALGRSPTRGALNRQTSLAEEARAKRLRG